MTNRKLAVVTGPSSGIGQELAFICAEDRYDLIIASDEASIEVVASDLRATGVSVEALQVDLADIAGVDRLCALVRQDGRRIDLLMLNAGRGLGHAFLDQEYEDIQQVIDTNVTGTVYLAHQLGRDMRSANHGRIMFTGSIAGFMPGSFQAVYNATKAFVDSFAFALRNELKDTQVSVTCLMPGPTDTDFFERADMLDTKVGAGKKDDPAMVARVGYDAMMRGDGDIVSGWKNKLQSTIANVTPAGLLAEQHRKMAEPGTDQ